MSSIKLLIRNLNVSNCDKSTTKEIFADSSSSISDVINLINNEQNLNKNIEIMHRGEILKRESPLSDFLNKQNNLNQISLFMVEVKKIQMTKEKPKDIDQIALSNHIAPIFKSKSKRTALEKILHNKQRLEEILKSVPNMDFISYAFIQSSDLLKLLADPNKSKIVQVKPNIYYGVKQLFNVFRETYKKVPSEGVFLTRSSFSVDEFSGEEDNAQPATSQQQQQINNFVNAMSGQRPGQPQNRNQPNINPALSRDFFARTMQQVLTQAFSNQQTPPSQQQQQQQQQQQPAQTSSSSALSASASTTRPASTASARPAPTGRTLTDDEIATKLEQMHEFGLWDDELNLRALQVTEGDVEASISLIMEGVDF